jgi:diaminopimelate decarboxylase
MKANCNPQILQRIYEAGIGFECVSTEEVGIRIFQKNPTIQF